MFDSVNAIIRATCVLHNFLRRRDGVSNDRPYIGQDDIRGDMGQPQEGGTCLTDTSRLGANNPARGAVAIRFRFADFSPEGMVLWQDAVVRRGRLH